MVYARNGQLIIHDLGSTNGTFVNGVSIGQGRVLQPRDIVQVGNSTLTLSVHQNHGANPATSWLSLLVIAVLAAITLLSIASANRASVVTASGEVSAQRPISVRPTTPSASTLSLSPLEHARLATVQIIGMAGGGSGGVVDPRGYILTNYHVVAQEAILLVALNSSRQDAAPEPMFRAQVVASDRDLDLALLQIVADDAGRPLSKGLDLVSLPIGDSDQVQLGDSIVILGFPDVGGATLTLTRGTVAGFSQDDLGHRRGWIKTDAEISPGNSGGAALNHAGELIGVPSLVSTEDRTLGRIGVLRSINLARPLMQRIPGSQ